MSEIDFRFWEAQLETPSGEELVREDGLVRLAVEAHVKGLFDVEHEVWEWLGKVVAQRHGISRDAAALAVEDVEMTYRQRIAGGVTHG